MKALFLFGGSGYISHFILKAFIESKKFDVFYVYDLKELIGFDSEIEKGLVVFNLTDVRKTIEIPNININIDDSWVFNLAAIHREPGHERHEYFDTNINGAKNMNDFLQKTGVKNLLFTSSIAPYGQSLEQRTEDSPLYPETPYGISKAMAELIHQNWAVGQMDRRLIVVRPSVIYGPNDPGNVFRMINAIKKGSFVIPGNGNIVKAYGYVYGLVDSILFVMEKNDKTIIYNYAENPIENLKGMVNIIKKQFNYKTPVFSIPIKFLVITAFFIEKIFNILGKKTNIHPVRVKKAGYPTNIFPKYLIDNGFQFRYPFEKSLLHWKQKAQNDF